MAMITCKKCGKEFSDSAKACPYCDTDIRYSREFGIPYVDPNLKSLEEKSKGNMAMWKLISGIISCVLFLLVSMQSCAAGLVNTIEENGEIGGSAGILVSLLLLSGGIVSICTRRKRGGNIAIMILYGLAALIGFTGAGGYGDLYIWSSWCIICAGLALISFVNSKK